jgi:cyclomaltodextrinase
MRKSYGIQMLMVIGLLAAWGTLPANGGQDPQPESKPKPKQDAEPAPKAEKPGAAAEKPAAPKGTVGAEYEVPSWVRTAVWYDILVPRFANGDPLNDPEGTLPWVADWLTPPTGKPLKDDDTAGLDHRSYGGDLAGVTKRLDYLKALAVNTLVLSPVFESAAELKGVPSDYRHVASAFGKATTRGQKFPASLNPKEWTITDSDRVLLELVKEAHAREMRVVLDLPLDDVGADHWAWQEVGKQGKQSPYAEWFEVSWSGSTMIPPTGPDRPGVALRAHPERGFAPSFEKHLVNIMRRWMDPNGDGDPSDGVDGWRVNVDSGKLPEAFLGRLRAEAKKVNPNAVIVAETRSKNLDRWLDAKVVDAVTDHGIGDLIRRFVSAGPGKYSIEKFVSDVQAHCPPGESLDRAARISVLSDAQTGRLLTMLTEEPNVRGYAAVGRPHPPTNIMLQRFRLAMALHCYSPGNLMFYYGEEAGMQGLGGPLARGPMWWHDLPAQAARTSLQQPELFSLTRSMGLLRDVYPFLGHAARKIIQTDPATGIFVVQWSGPGAELYTVINTGTKEQRVMVPIGEPEQMVGMMRPQLKPSRMRKNPTKFDPTTNPPSIPRLRYIRARQYANADGDVSIAIPAQTVWMVVLWTASQP